MKHCRRSVSFAAFSLLALTSHLPAQAPMRVRPVRREVNRDSVTSPATPRQPLATPRRATSVPRETETTLAASSKHPRRSVVTARVASAQREITAPVSDTANRASLARTDGGDIVAVAPSDTATPDSTRRGGAIVRTAAAPTDSAAAVPAAGSAAAVPAALTPAPAPPSSAATPAAVQIGMGSVKFSGAMQAWYVGGSGDVTNTFRLRRAELKFAGTLTPRAGWTVMVDLAKPLRVSGGTVNQASLLLQDAYATLKAKRLAVDVGQMKLPASYEGSVSSASSLETVDYALFISEGKAALVRDLGVAISGPLSSDIRFKAGIFNGTGESQNTTDLNDTKAVAGRLEVQTVLPGLKVATSGVWSGPVAADSLRRDRVGVDAQFTRGPVTLRSEWLRAWDAASERVGYYLLGAYRFRTVELVGRHDVFDRAAGSAAATPGMRERDYLAGVNYRISGDNVRLQANYVFRTFDGLSRRELVLLNVQTAW